MALRADQLKQTAISTSALESIVREQLRMIDTKIQNSDKTFGRNVVRVELETSFSIPGLAKSEQQRYVYSKLLQSIAERGFEVKIVLDQTYTCLYIAYTLEFDQAQLDAMNTIIRNGSLRPEQVDAFCKRDAAEAQQKNGPPA